MFKFSSQLITGPTQEPVTVAQAKLHLRVDFSQDDNLIGALISAAREYAENYCNRAFFAQTWTLTLDTFPYIPQPFSSWIDAFAINIPRPRLQSIESITYYDQFYNQQSVSSSLYFVDSNSEPARIAPVNGQTWPYPAIYVPGTVQLTYICGSYGTGDTYSPLPVSIQQAILLLVGHWYANREAVGPSAMTPVPLAVQALLEPYRVHSLLV